MAADTVDRQTRSRNMAAIRSRDTKPEWRVRSALHRAGLRYRLQVRKLPGTPDLVFAKFRAAVFVHGCFWHRHQGCKNATTPSSNVDFWQEKFQRNMVRDANSFSALQRASWRVAVLWECAVRNMSDEEIAQTVGDWLRSDQASLEIPPPATDKPAMSSP